MEIVSRYWKAVIAATTAIAITTLQVVLSQQADGQWTLEDTLVSVLALLGAVGVLAKANTTTDEAVARRESVVLVAKHARPGEHRLTDNGRG